MNYEENDAFMKWIGSLSTHNYDLRSAFEAGKNYENKRIFGILNECFKKEFREIKDQETKFLY